MNKAPSNSPIRLEIIGLNWSLMRDRKKSMHVSSLFMTLLIPSHFSFFKISRIIRSI